MKVSILLPSYKRVHLLAWGLHSLSQQKVPFEFEVIVLNEGPQDRTEDICDEHRDKLDIKYLWSANGWEGWRTPGFALNIGAKKAKGDVLILSCAEIFHLNHTIEILSTPFLTEEKVITIPDSISLWDDNRNFLRFLNNHPQGYEVINEGSLLPKSPILNSVGFLKLHYLPFMMGVSKKIFLDIGGYDEDFTGYSWDDNDIVDRLKDHGCRRIDTEAKAIHLFHPRVKGAPRQRVRNGVNHNRRLYNERKGVVKRNVGRPWGTLGDMKIPKVIHQIWVGDPPIPPKFLDYIETWKSHHSDWDFKLWTDLEVSKEKFINQDQINSARNMAEKADLIRYEIIYKYGGVYVDVDFECYKCIAPLIRDSETFIVRSIIRRGVFCNGIFGSTPKSDFMTDLINFVPQRFHGCRNRPTNHRTGPYLLTQVIRNYKLRNGQSELYRNMSIMPFKFFFPYGIRDRANHMDTDFSHLEDCYAAHRWFHSWG